MKHIFLRVYSSFLSLTLSYLIVIFIFSSCQKEFLEKKPDRSQLVPKSVADFQALLDQSMFYRGPAVQEISSDDFTISDQGILALEEMEVMAYTWSPNLFINRSFVDDWDLCYRQIFVANVILEGVEAIQSAERDGIDYNSVKGNALFQRAFAYYNLAQLFAAPYDTINAASLPGIPIRPVPDINARYPRGTIQQTYDQILNDVAAALVLLPDQVGYKHRPSKTAALAFLARIYLTMGNYTKAAIYADQTLKTKNALLDYNQIKGSATARIMPSALPNGNAEVILFKGSINYLFPTSTALANVLPELYQSYDKDDLRKTLFFRDRGNGVFTFRGGYGGNIEASIFTGLATDEIYLIRAECAARNGDVNLALSDLNHLLQTRWVTGRFLPYTSTNAEDVLRIILKERRKELICRGSRWTDLRRLNLESRFAIPITRTVNGKSYQLLPNENRYTFPLPDYEVNTGLAQNP
jgi:tetratricopeptide (TPR) repeat protein